jgi:hypothetical protein
MRIELYFGVAALVITLVIGAIFIPIIRKAMSENSDPRSVDGE